MVIILGVVSFYRMTPDLLPSINLPYAMIMTVYAGATPEEVESEVTQPLEESMATLDNIKNITSTSSENLSIITLEFESDASMDNVVSEIREEINNISDGWDELVSTPYIMEINLDMMPVVISAVDYDGMDSVELTAFLEDEMMTTLEGIEGVASIDVSGSVTEQVNVFLSQEKIDALNAKIIENIGNEFQEAADEIEEGESELNDGLSELESADAELAEAEQELAEGQDTLADETSAAQAEIQDQQFELAESKQEVQDQLEEAEDGLAELESAKESLEDAYENYNTLTQSKSDVNEVLSALYSVQSQYPSLQSEADSLEAKIQQLEEADSVGNASLITEYSSQLADVEAQIAVLDATLTSFGTDIDHLDSTIAGYESNLATIESGLSTIDSELSSMGITASGIPSAISEIEDQIDAIEDGISQLEAALEQIEDGSLTLSEALEQVNYAQISGALDLSEGYTQVVVGQSAIDSALAELEVAQSEIDSAKDQLLEAQESTYASSTMEITMDMINLLLTAQDFSMPAGYITEDDVQYLIRVGDEVESLEELENLALLFIDVEGVGNVTLSDVADVVISDTSAEIYTKVDQEDAIMLSFNKQSTAATADVSENISNVFAELEEEYDGLSFLSLTDQGYYIDMIVGNVLGSLMYGAIFAIIVLILFLRDIRPTIIVACSIPVSLLCAISLMYFSGISLNLISISGLAVGVGMLVDNSVVVIENIFRMRSEGESRIKAAYKGAVQVSGAIFASTLTTVCVFLPIVFIEGITRELFTDMALTIAYSLGASLLVAITLVPAMASMMLGKQKEQKERYMSKLVNGYEKLARASLQRKWIVLAGSVALLVLSIFACVIKGFSFMPTVSGTQVMVTITPEDEDTTFDELTVIADEAYDRIEGIEEIDSIGVVVSETDVVMYAVMSEDAKRKDSEVSEDIEEFCGDLNCTVEAAGTMDVSALINGMGSSGVTVQIFGDDLDALIEEGELLAAQLETVEGIDVVDTGAEDHDPEYDVIVDASAASKNGLTVAEVYQSVALAMTTEQESIEVSIDGTMKEVVIYQDEEDNLTIEDLKDYVLEYTDAYGEDKEVQLTDIAEIVETESLDSISRENQNRTLTVSATIADDYNVTLVTSDVEDLLEDYEPIDGNTIEVGGESETIMEAITQLGYMMILAVIMIYFIMVAQFQSYKAPFVVMFTIPLAFTGGFIALLLMGLDVSVMSMIGFVMLAGIIVNNGIVLVDYINNLRAEGMPKQEAIIQAGKTRMRPILMTASTTILGLVVMAAAVGVGTEMMQPVAVVCIGGLAYATLMTLFVVPAMYDILSTNRVRRRKVD